jgi:5-methylcytosine-specific restriction endonuclease McrA
VNKGYDQTRRKKLKDQGLCTACGKPAKPEKTLCKGCQSKITEATRKNRAKKIAEGGCGQCCGVGVVATVGKVCWRCWLRERAYAATGSSNDWKALDDLWQKQGGRCAYTGDMLVPGANASIDHILPKARGGALGIGNLQWVTLTVNRAKRELTNDEFFALCRRVIAVVDAS